MGELEDKALGELTPMGELESPDGVDPMTELRVEKPSESRAAILTVEKVGETNFAGNVRAQAPTATLHPASHAGQDRKCCSECQRTSSGGIDLL